MKVFVAVLIIVLAIMFRFWNLGAVDYHSDELHYASDAFRHFNQDPFISVRHHPFAHPAPSVGHPFLQPLLSSVMFNVFGHSLLVPRMIPAIFGVATVILLLLLSPIFGARTSYLSALFLSILPFSVRFSRDGHLDSLLTFFITASVVLLLLFNKSKKWWLLVLVGISNALAISTKLDGGISLIISLIVLFIIGFGRKPKQLLKYLFISTSLTLIPCVFLAFILNDPSAYIDGIFRPADRAYQIHSLMFWIKPAFLMPFWTSVFWNMFSPVVMIFSVIAIATLIIRRSKLSKVLLVWIVFLLPLTFLHGPGTSGEYGLLPLAPGVLLAMNFAFARRKLYVFLLPIILISLLVFSFFYGIRLKPVVYAQRDSVDITHNTNLHSEIIMLLNKAAPENGKIFFAPQTDYPFFALRPDLSWSYFGEIADFDATVLENPETMNKYPNFQMTQSFSEGQYGIMLKRYIFLRD